MAWGARLVVLVSICCAFLGAAPLAAQEAEPPLDAPAEPDAEVAPEAEAEPREEPEPEVDPNVERARLRFDQGERFFGVGDFGAALAEFERV